MINWISFFSNKKCNSRIHYDRDYFDDDGADGADGAVDDDDQC